MADKVNCHAEWYRLDRKHSRDRNTLSQSIVLWARALSEWREQSLWGSSGQLPLLAGQLPAMPQSLTQVLTEHVTCALPMQCVTAFRTYIYVLLYSALKYVCIILFHMHGQCVFHTKLRPRDFFWRMPTKWISTLDILFCVIKSAWPVAFIFQDWNQFCFDLWFLTYAVSGLC